MTGQIEDAIMAEARRQGFQPNAAAMMQAAIDLAGSALTDQGLIQLPGRGSISPADFVRDLLGRIPSAFASVAGERKAETTTMGNLTEQMRQEVAASRRQRALPSDWLAVRSKATGVTARYMAERERNWK